MIPVDSRFCSYCAADLRHTLNAFVLGADAETAILIAIVRPHQLVGVIAIALANMLATIEHAAASDIRWIIAAIFAISFIIKMIVLNVTVPAAPPPEDSGSVAPSDTAPSGDDLPRYAAFGFAPGA